MIVMIFSVSREIQDIQTSGVRKACSSLLRKQGGITDEARIGRLELSLANVHEKCREITTTTFKVGPLALEESSTVA